MPVPLRLRMWAASGRGGCELREQKEEGRSLAIATEERSMREQSRRDTNFNTNRLPCHDVTAASDAGITPRLLGHGRIAAAGWIPARPPSASASSETW